MKRGLKEDLAFLRVGVHLHLAATTPMKRGLKAMQRGIDEEDEGRSQPLPR